MPAPLEPEMDAVPVTLWIVKAPVGDEHDEYVCRSRVEAEDVGADDAVPVEVRYLPAADYDALVASRDRAVEENATLKAALPAPEGVVAWAVVNDKGAYFYYFDADEKHLAEARADLMNGKVEYGAVRAAPLYASPVALRAAGAVSPDDVEMRALPIPSGSSIITTGVFLRGVKIGETTSQRQAAFAADMVRAALRAGGSNGK